MNIGFYRWSETNSATKNRTLQRASANIDAVTSDVQAIINDVKSRGDKALLDFAKKFDGADLNSLTVSEEEIEAACQSIDPHLARAIDHCAGNVQRFHEEQLRRVEQSWMHEIEPGVWAGEQVSPIPSVGLYVPGGKNLYPSAVYMLSIPAVIAKVPQIIMVTPPNADGSVGDALLYAAHISGITEIYKIGGAGALAALAYGTDTVPAVKKVLGPGSPYVAAAKQVLSPILDPGMPAGPSESIILCDESANPANTILDILNEAEHGPDSAALLVTHDEKLAQYALKNLPKEIESLPEPQQGYCKTVMETYGGIILTDSLEESIAFANAYAVEHLLLKVKNPDDVIPQIYNAGEILIGENTPIVLGNYGTGVNHVLPTSAKAHTYSCTSIWDFLKRTSLTQCDSKGLKNLKESVLRLTEYEQFPAHGNALRKRQS